MKSDHVIDASNDRRDPDPMTLLRCMAEHRIGKIESSMVYVDLGLERLLARIEPIGHLHREHWHEAGGCQ